MCPKNEKMKKIILLILFFSLSFNLYAYTPKAEIDPKNEKWNWVLFAINKKTNAQLYVDFSKKEELGKGRYLYPTLLNASSSRIWHMSDCNTMKSSSLGVFVKADIFRWESGLAVFDNPHEDAADSFYTIATKMMCGIKTTENKLIFGFMNVQNSFLGWYPEDVIKLPTADSYQVTVRGYNIITGSVSNTSSKDIINCSETSIKRESGEKYPTADTPVNPSGLYLIASICEYAKSSILPNGSYGPTIKLVEDQNISGLNDKQTNTVENESLNSESQMKIAPPANESNPTIGDIKKQTTPRDKTYEQSGGYDPITNEKVIDTKTPETQSAHKISIEEAKKSCVELGFKPKTEKFGKCVLELSK